jgi:GNAT superfamily N-acetyltransferase
MVVSIEPLTSNHLSLDAVKSLFPHGVPSEVLNVEAGGGVARAILCDGEVVGTVIVIQGSGELMMAIDAPYRRRGIATEALRQVLAVSRDDKGFEKLTATTQIGKPSNSLLALFGAVEVNRTLTEINYEVPLHADANE